MQSLSLSLSLTHSLQTAALRHQMHTVMFCKDQLDVITHGLFQMFHTKSMKVPS